MLIATPLIPLLGDLLGRKEGSQGLNESSLYAKELMSFKVHHDD